MYVMKEVLGNTPLHDRNVRMRTIGEIAPHITPAIVQKRIKLWKSFENSEIDISDARKKNTLIENNIDVQMQDKISQESKK